MKPKSQNGLTLLDKCCSVLFESKDERFLICVLTKVPKIQDYLYSINKEGWLPLFRNLNLFGASHSNENTIQTSKVQAQSILDTLKLVNYDFLEPSGLEMNDVDKINTFELLLLLHSDPELMK